MNRGTTSWLGGFLVLFFQAIAVPAVDGPAVLVAHLPSTPVETASRQAEAITTLVNYLSEQVPGAELEAEIFRRAGDAERFLSADGDRVSLVLSEAPFVLSLPAAAEIAPTWRSLRQGQTTFRRLLVVKKDSTAQTLGDLQGASLSIVESLTGEAETSSLEARVFEGELDPASWFGRLERVADDFTATANVLYGQTDAALVAEYNPLLVSHLEKDLRAVFESPPQSLPVLSVRGVHFDGPQLEALEKALAEARTEPKVQAALETLGWEGFAALNSRDLSALESPSRSRSKDFELALPVTALPDLEIPPPPAASTLPFALAVEVPELPLDPDAFGVH